MNEEEVRFREIGASNGDEFVVWLYDIDQRRHLTVFLPEWRQNHDNDEEWAAGYQKARALARGYIDRAAGDALGIRVNDSGCVTFVNELDDDLNQSNHYPPLAEFQLPQGSVRTLLRSEITELDRLSAHVDLVSYAGVERAVFKYQYHWRGFGPMWQETQIHARLPPHPNILPLDRLVLDEISGTRVVGFTTPFVLGGDLKAGKNRQFKLKHLKQLTQVVDDLNYKFGIVHHDMAARNLFIDPATDDLILFDFSVAAKIGYRPKRFHLSEATRALEERNDVKGVVLTVYDLITRDPYCETRPLHHLDETDLLAGPAKWIKHPDVELESDLDAVDYYDELVRWVPARRERPITVYTQASEPINWPTEMDDPPAGLKTYNRDEAKEHNLPFIEWVRPLSAHLDRSRRLLATGKYADESSSSGGVVVDIGKEQVVESKPRSPPQPQTSPTATAAVAGSLTDKCQGSKATTDETKDKRNPPRKRTLSAPQPRDRAGTSSPVPPVATEQTKKQKTKPRAGPEPEPTTVLEDQLPRRSPRLLARRLRAAASEDGTDAADAVGIPEQLEV